MRTGTGTVTLLALFACVSPAWADDVVELRNGDRLTGTVEKLDGEALVFSTPYAKGISVAWKEVASLTTDEPAWVKLATGEYVSARFTRRDDGMYLETATPEGSRHIELDQVAAIGVPPGAHWSGNVAFILYGSHGNTESFALGLGAAGLRETDDDRLRFGGRLERREDDDREIVKNTRGWVNYDYFLGPHWYLSGFLTLEYDRFKDLNLRTVVGAGPGYRFIDTKKMLLSADVALAYVNENFRAQADRNYVAAAIGEEFRWNISDSQSIYQLVDVYPSLEDGEDVFLHAELGFRHAIAKAGLYIEVALVDDYDNLPADGRENNDLKYFVQLGYQL